MKLLIDECLSPRLVGIARERGFPDATHVGWLGRAGLKDWQLMPLILDGDWTFVTRNAVDFRGPRRAPGTAGEYRRADIHAGLVCLEGPVGMDLGLQQELFDLALAELALLGDLTNRCLEVRLASGKSDEVEILVYDLPVTES